MLLQGKWVLELCMSTMQIMSGIKTSFQDLSM